jgi:hypothetical protein
MPPGDSSDAVRKFRLVHEIELDPAFFSLGLKPEDFRPKFTSIGTGFDAALNGPNGTLWLFRGSQFITYDLLTDQLVSKPKPIAENFAVTSLDPSFRFGIDAAVWGGPTFPDSWFMYRDNQFVRLNSRPNGENLDLPPSEWVMTLEPTNTTQEFLRIPAEGGGAAGSFNMDASVILHGMRDAEDRAHFFNQNGQYARHNFQNGEADITPGPITAHWPLPEPFASRIDLAFYGAGDQQDQIYLCNGFQFVQFDNKLKQVVKIGALEERFPQLAVFTKRPQLFFVEDYVMEVYAGPLTLGAPPVGSMSVPAQSERKTVVVTTIVTTATTAQKQNLLESQSSEAVKDFYNKVEKRQETDASAESYQYRMNALFHGEAQAKGFWGGEVDASLNVEGGSDTQRNRLAKMAFGVVQNQVRESTNVLSQVTMSTESAESVTQSVVSKEEFTIKNTTMQTRQSEFFPLVQPFVSLIILKSVQAAFTDGISPPRIFPVAQLPVKLPELLADNDGVERILTFVRRDLSSITDFAGKKDSVLVGDESIDINLDIPSNFTFAGSDPIQQVSIRGIIKGANPDVQSTSVVRLVDV